MFRSFPQSAIAFLSRRCYAANVNIRGQSSIQKRFLQEVVTPQPCLVPFNIVPSSSCWCRTFSQYHAPSRDSGESKESEEADERDGERNQATFRRYKKIFSTLLFSGTLIAVAFARRKKRNETEELFRGCTRLPIDDNITGSFKEYYVYGKTSDNPGCVVPAESIRDGTMKAVKSFEVKEDDIFVASFPKTGTTWVQEIVYLLVNNLDTEKASASVLEKRFPFLEYPFPGLKTVLYQPSPRLMKTHMPMNLLPDDIGKAKVIYIVRNPKDTVVSYYHFYRMVSASSYKGSFSQFLDKFKKDQVMYSPFFWHLESYRKHEGENLLLVTYEDLLSDPKAVIAKIAEFIGRPLTNDQLDFLVQHTSFAEMSKNPSVNYSHWDDIGFRNKNEAPFMRKGRVGDWKNYFTDDMSSDFDAWIEKNNKGNFKFRYE